MNTFIKLLILMKISPILNFTCFSLLIGGLVSQTSSYAQNVSQPQLIVQSTTNNDYAAIKSQAEKMINLFFEQEFDLLSNSVIPELKVSFSPEKMKKAWQDIKEENGNFVKMAESKVIDTPGSDLVTVTMEFEKVKEDWIFIFNDNQQLVGISAPIIFSKDISTIAGEFMDSVISGNYSNARTFLHPFLKETIFPEQIESGWNKLLLKNGKFEQILSTNIKRSSTLENMDIIEMNLQFDKSKEKILVILDKSKHIIGVDFVQ